jgi:hypothetical protein
MGRPCSPVFGNDVWLRIPLGRKILYEEAYGRLAQLVRASRLHREGREFESLAAYQVGSMAFVKILSRRARLA